MGINNKHYRSKANRPVNYRKNLYKHNRNIVNERVAKTLNFSLIVLLIVSSISLVLYISFVGIDNSKKYLISAITLILGVLLKSIHKVSIKIACGPFEEQSKNIKSMRATFEIINDVIIGGIILFILIISNQPAIGWAAYIILSICLAILISSFAFKKHKVKIAEIYTINNKRNKKIWAKVKRKIKRKVQTIKRCSQHIKKRLKKK